MMEEKEFEPFFEGYQEERFQEEVRKFPSKEAFLSAYAQLNEFVDTSDVAELGVIRLQNTPTAAAAKDWEGTHKMEIDRLIAIIQDGGPIPPLVVDQVEIDFSRVNPDLHDKLPFFSVKNPTGWYAIAACHNIGIEYIPAVVYQSKINSGKRPFDNFLSMEELLDVDFGTIYDLSLLSTELNAQSVEDTLELLGGGVYYERNPEHVLGTPHQRTNAFGKEVTYIQGRLADALERIEVVEIDVPNTQDLVIDTDIKPSLSALLEEEEAVENMVKVIRQHKKKSKSWKSLIGRDLHKEDYELQSFDEVIDTYNQDLSEEEIRVWVWHKRRTDGFNDEAVILNTKNGWSKYVVPNAQVKRKIKEWMKSGLLCYVDGDYLPSVLYYAENIYERLNNLERERSEIVKRFGKKQYEQQKQGLEAVKPPSLSFSDEVVENRLSLKPISNFAEEMMVSELSDGTVFMDKWGHDPEPANLRKAFSLWLVNLPPTDYKNSSSFQIIKYYLANSSPISEYGSENGMRIKQNAKKEGESLFARFLFEALLKEDQIRIEKIWNERFNGYVSINYFKIPVGFQCSTTFKNKPLFVRPAQREGVGFLSVHGSGCIAYDVGVGKTMTGILSIAQAIESGMCKRPLIVVPNATYKNWLGELRGELNTKGRVKLSGILPQYPVNDLYNLGSKYIDRLKDEFGDIDLVPENTISVITIEGMKRLGFRKETLEDIGKDLYHILNQSDQKGNEDKKQKTKREQSALYKRIEKLTGIGLGGSTVNIEDLGFDFMLVDEAHHMRKIFTRVKGQSGSSRYDIQSSDPSITALKGFMLSQYILRKNNNKNIVLLTATPFSNSPLEIYSMLSLIGFHRLAESNISSLEGFFNEFIKTTLQLSINTRMEPVREEVVLGFNNLIALQKLIYKFIDYKSGEDADIQRPNKWVLPLTHKKVGDEYIPLPVEERVGTELQFTPWQQELNENLSLYILGKLQLADFCQNPEGLEEESSKKQPYEIVLDEDKLSDNERMITRILRAITYARQIALSPYLLSCVKVDWKTITPQEFIDSSPKLQYTMGCIRSVKKYHEARNEDVSGQVIYANAGTAFFPLIKEYLVEKIGFQSDEVEMIIGGMDASKKERAKERFNSGEAKVLIGSNTIKEGVNLQKRASCLYNLWLEWNPSDILQLFGRIWRYGNRYADVRLVITLMMNSIDSSIFQKQEEKTSRINEIWQRNGKSNSMNLEEFNPGELKLNLISDPRMLAKLLLIEEAETIRDEIAGLKAQQAEISNVVKSRAAFRNAMPKVEKAVLLYRPLKKGQNGRKPATTLKLFKDYMEDDNENATRYELDHYQIAKSTNYSLQRALERILQPRGLDLNFDETQVIGRINSEIKSLEKELDRKAGEAAIENKALWIIEERERKGFEPKTVEERVEEFASLNERVLSGRMQYGPPAKKEEEEDDLIAEMEKLLAEFDVKEEQANEGKGLSNAA